MKEQDLDSPLYSENDQSVILVQKNNICERKLKHKGTDTTQATQTTTQAIQEATGEEQILSAIQVNAKISQTQKDDAIGVSVDTVKYYIRKMWKEHIKQLERTQNANVKFLRVFLLRRFLIIANKHPIQAGDYDLQSN